VKAPRAPLVHPDAVARRDHGLRDPAPAGVVITLSGEVLRVLEDGQVERVLPGGWPRPGYSHAAARRRKV
jgi:hypothetical protein